MHQPDIRPTENDGEYRVFEDYSALFGIERVKNGKIYVQNVSIIVPKGFLHDGASVPRLAWSFMPPDGLHRAAALIHDYLYWTQGRCQSATLTRAECDYVFLMAMKASKVPFFRRQTAYRAVRIFGGLVWDKNFE